MTDNPARQSDQPQLHRTARFDPLSLVLAWLVPGLGHLWIGERRRGVLLLISILGMFLIGVLVGGVDVVDRHEAWLWFLPQVLAGPVAFAADYLNLTFVTTGRIGTPSLGRVHEIGTLYCALAGLVNLAAMIDAATRPLPPRRRGGAEPFLDRRRPSASSVSTSEGGAS